MLSLDDERIFEQARPRLLGLAYRILGSASDAEDAVQDTFLRWAHTDRAAIQRPAAWLTTACTRRCLDLLRAAHRVRVDYVGTWLPEPVRTAGDHDAETNSEFASSLTTAFMLMLERLTPKERAAYLLHEIFDMSYTEVAGTLVISEASCRKLVSRAKANVDRDRIRHTMAPDRQDRFLKAFQSAVTDGATSQLAALLASDVRLSADGGGRVPTIRNTLCGERCVLDFVRQGLHRYWAGLEWQLTLINSVRGAVLVQNGRPEATVSFALNEQGHASDIFIVRNPDKLANLGVRQVC